MEPLNMYEKKLKNTFMKKFKNSETRNLRKSVFLLQSPEPLYTCPSVPFYRETKGHLHTDIASDLKNIPNGNMYMNVFYIP
jgi:hypothetical protein